MAVRLVRGDRPGTLGTIGGMPRWTGRERLERYVERVVRETGCEPVCYFCAGVPTTTLRLETGWERAACEACLVANGVVRLEQAMARQVSDLRALLVELG